MLPDSSIARAQTRATPANLAGHQPRQADPAWPHQLSLARQHSHVPPAVRQLVKHGICPTQASDTDHLIAWLAVSREFKLLQQVLENMTSIQRVVISFAPSMDDAALHELASTLQRAVENRPDLHFRALEMRISGTGGTLQPRHVEALRPLLTDGRFKELHIHTDKLDPDFCKALSEVLPVARLPALLVSYSPQRTRELAPDQVAMLSTALVEARPDAEFGLHSRNDRDDWLTMSNTHPAARFPISHIDPRVRSISLVRLGLTALPDCYGDRSQLGKLTLIDCFVDNSVSTHLFASTHKVMNQMFGQMQLQQLRVLDRDEAPWGNRLAFIQVLESAAHNDPRSLDTLTFGCGKKGTSRWMVPPEKYDRVRSCLVHKLSLTMIHGIKSADVDYHNSKVRQARLELAHNGVSALFSNHYQFFHDADSHIYANIGAELDNRSLLSLSTVNKYAAGMQGQRDDVRRERQQTLMHGLEVANAFVMDSITPPPEQAHEAFIWCLKSGQLPFAEKALSQIELPQATLWVDSMADLPPLYLDQLCSNMLKSESPNKGIALKIGGQRPGQTGPAGPLKAADAQFMAAAIGAFQPTHLSLPVGSFDSACMASSQTGLKAVHSVSADAAHVNTLEIGAADVGLQKDSAPFVAMLVHSLRPAKLVLASNIIEPDFVAALVKELEALDLSAGARPMELVVPASMVGDPAFQKLVEQLKKLGSGQVKVMFG